MVSPCFWQIFSRGCSMIFDCPVDRSWCAQRCCDGPTELRRRCADQLRRGHSARRVRDGADAAATELMLRAALLRRSWLQRSRCCDEAAQTSSVALILRVASRRDALNEEPASFPPVPRVDLLNSMVVAHSPRPPPYSPVILGSPTGYLQPAQHSQ